MTNQPSAQVELQGVTISYPQDDGSQKVVLNAVDLSMAKGEFACIVGTNGCGKSTILRLILGSQFPNSGTVRVGGKEVDRAEGDRGIMSQKCPLFPHLTVVENIEWGLIQRDTNLLQRSYDNLFASLIGTLVGYVALIAGLFVWFLQFLYPGMMARAGLRVEKEYPRLQPQRWYLATWTRVRRALLARGYLEILDKAREEALQFIVHIGLTRSDGDKFPGELSGGMRQRVAIAQAVIMKPTVLLMDEPFGSLDPPTREDMQLFILEQWQEHGLTILFVTHDTSEACFLGSRVIVLGKQSHAEGARIVKDTSSPRGSHPNFLEWRETAEFGTYCMSVNAAMRSPEQ